MNKLAAQDSERSAGWSFLKAAHTAIPKTMGDRDSMAILHRAMSLAIDGRFEFASDDGPALKRLGVETSVGVFRPLALEFYRQACVSGGTYPRMWETHQKMKPWKASKVVDPRESPTTLFSGRVAPGLCILLPEEFQPETLTLGTYRGMQVWWCTDFDNEEINICRYAEVLATRNAELRREGAPARRRQLTRKQWDDAQNLI